MREPHFYRILFFTFFYLSTYAAKVDTLTIASIAMNKTYKAAIVLPDSYVKSKINYPVLYLLHGADGHFDNWLKKTPNKKLLHELADQYNMIIVTPEGEKYSFYIDRPGDKANQFETHIAKEVIQKIDATYRTINNKNGRMITGLSMGGHGALYLATQYPELFCAAGSMSGALDMDTLLESDPVKRLKKMTEMGFAESSVSEGFKPYSIVNLTEKIKENNLALLIDCGVDDFLIESNRELHRRLVYNKTPHDYIERPGAHSWQYWEDALPYHFLFFNKFLKKNNL
jgi:putative tributyrin esterase